MGSLLWNLWKSLNILCLGYKGDGQRLCSHGTVDVREGADMIQAMVRECADMVKEMVRDCADMVQEISERVQT